MRFRPLLPAALILAVVLAAPPPVRAQTPVPEESLSLIAGAQQTAFFEVLEDVAENAGFFKEQHLHVDVQYAGNPANASQLVASGKGDIVSTSLEPLIQGYDKGLRLTAFFNRNPQYQWVLAVLADSPIRTLADFKGTTLGEYAPGSAAEFSTNAMLRGAGLRSGDVNYIVIGGGAQAIEALNTRRVAGAAFPYAELAIYEVVAGMKFRFFWNPLLRDISDVGFCATPATIQTKADALRRFTRAIAEASVLIRVNPSLAARYFLEGAGMKQTDEALSNETKLLITAGAQLPGADPTSKTIGALGTRNASVLAKWMADNGMAAHVVPATAIVTDQFIPYANDFDHKALIARVKAMR
jgi:NitT/TauT family transport system substrate-binding protein